MRFISALGVTLGPGHWLAERSLRVCNHMIVDAKTAQELVLLHQQSATNSRNR